jgi:cell volume regulation protein A
VETRLRLRIGILVGATKGGIDIGRNIVDLLMMLGALLVTGVVMTKVASRIGVPALVLFILVGMLLGSDIGGVIYFSDPWVAQLVGTIALVIILFDGGLQTKWKHLRRVAVPAASMATVGVAVQVGIMGILARLVLGLPWPLAIMVGAIVGSTDAAAVFAVIGNQNVPERLKATLEAESGFNDPMAVFLTVLMIEWAQHGPPNPWQAIGALAWEMAVGLAVGLLAGWLASRWVVRLRFEASGLYPILLFAFAMLTFGVTGWLHASGFLAVYVLAVYLGSVEIPYRQSVMRFHEATAWLAQMVMFILLGLLVFPRQMPAVVAPGMLLAAGLMLIARPVAVFSSTLGMGFAVRERLLLAWAGLRGAVPIVLATYPMLAGLPHSGLIFHVVFFVVLTSTAIQGALISPVAAWLGLLGEPVPPRGITLEFFTMEKLNAAMLEIVLPEGADVVGQTLAELPLPEHATVSALVRDGRVVAPNGDTTLHAGDTLFVLSSKGQIAAVRALLEGPD